MTTTKATYRPAAPASESLPAGLTAYKRTPVFDSEALPPALRQEHSTKPGVWGVIHVLEGRLAYTTFEPQTEQILAPDAPGVVRPKQVHRVEPLGHTRFFVEFYRVET